jgi:hypothetical protein
MLLYILLLHILKNNMFYSGLNGPTIEKDPEIQKLRQNVANKMWEIVKENEPNNVPAPEVNFVSFEEALKELASLKKSS